MQTAASYVDALREGRWFGSLAPEMQEGLVSRAVVRELAAEQVLFRRGDRGDGLFAVLDGAIRISARAEGGREIILARIEPPSFFGEISILDGQPRTHDAIADGRTVIFQVPDTSLAAFLERQPAFWRDIGALSTTKLRLMFAYVEELTLVPIVVRLARRLLILAEGHGDRDAKERTIALKQEQLASMLAISRQTVNQLLKDFETKGILRLAYGQLELLDVLALRRAAQLGATVPPP